MTDEISYNYDTVKGMNYSNESLLIGISRHTINSGSVYGSIFTGAGIGYKGGPSRSINATWWACVKRMGAWYQSNIHTYQGTTTASEALKGKQFYQCDLIGTGVADDCSGFVKACLQAFGVPGIDTIWVTTANMQPGSQFDRLLKSNGFIYMPYSPMIVSPGDIICGSANTHTEIYAGKEDGRDKSYSWGNIHDGISTRKQRNPQGMPSAMSKMNYKHIWRKT